MAVYPLTIYILVFLLSYWVTNCKAAPQECGIRTGLPKRTFSRILLNLSRLLTKPTKWYVLQV